MINVYDIAYSLGVTVSAPFWLTRTKARQKVLKAFTQRMGRVQKRTSRNQSVLIHAVSLGEINATPRLVKLLQGANPKLHVTVSVTTDTGYARGEQIYGSSANVTLVRFPLDFTQAINRFLNDLRPTVAVLMELEIWPNFLRQCEKRNIPVLLINGRMTPNAYDNYRLGKPIVKRMLRRIATICAQDKLYADRFIDLGAEADKVKVTGTMKFDTAQISDRVAGDDELAMEVGLPSPSVVDRDVWVCGSTGPGEEPLVVETYKALLEEFPLLRLVIVPRKPERFDEVAQLIRDSGYKLERRSHHLTLHDETSIILGDTMGELRKFYSIASIIFVGRTLVDLGSKQHGSDMIEPAALAKPVIVGQYTHNFAEPMTKFREAKGIVEVLNTLDMIETLRGWLRKPEKANEIGRRAQVVVQQNQGATAIHSEIILDQLSKIKSPEV